MKERPIIFSTDMVKAILEGRKHQTRRVMKVWAEGASWLILESDMHRQYLMPEAKDALIAKCPYGQVGDRLWVRETWWQDQSGGCWGYKADGIEWPPPNCGGKSMPSIFMPQWASRITLEITGVRVERLQEITEGDMVAEGIINKTDVSGAVKVVKGLLFTALWDSINAERGYGWDTNPWVWVISFGRIEL